MPVPDGTMTVSVVALIPLTEVPGLEPKSTPWSTETKPVPVTVTVLVPAAGPLLGLTPVTVGGGL